MSLNVINKQIILVSTMVDVSIFRGKKKLPKNDIDYYLAPLWLCTSLKMCKSTLSLDSQKDGLK